MKRYADQQHEKSSRRTTAAVWLSAWLFCCFAAVVGNAHAQITLPGPGIINTIVGNGTAGYTGDGGAATLAELRSPVGTAVDGAGNVYIADFSDNRVRQVNASSGIITTVAGNGIAGYSGDGGPATAARLNEPQGVAVDTAGNIYIAEYGNNRIRKVTASTGIITTVAGNGTAGYSGDGGQATSGELYSPYGVAVDAAGNIYIGDTNNERIRKVTVSAGVITTVAGNGTAGYSGDGGAATSAKLYNPFGLAVDAAGNIYISDGSNQRIRKVTVSTSVITTVAGNGTAGYSGDGGAATSAELFNPYGVAVDTAGNIYIADVSNKRIREVTVSTGIITTVAGNGTQGYTGDSGPATSAELSATYGVSIDAAANIYMADDGNARIRVVGTTSATVTVASSFNPSAYGNAVSFTATVRSGGSGTVTFKDGSTTLGTGTLSSGIATYSTSALAMGTHSITAVYSGGGTSPALIQTVANASAITVASSLNPSTYGTTVTFTATVTPSSATGTVMFMDGTTSLGTAAVSGGTATYSTSVLTSGTHPVTAVYSGNWNYVATASSVLTQTVNTASTSVVLVSSLNPAIYGNTVTFTATVTPSSATGTITFMDGAATLATVTMNSGKAIYGTGALTAGAHSITAVYSGDAEYAESTSSALTETVSASTILPGPGIINTIAGKGTGGYSGDGGPATLAALNPVSVAVDTAGNVYDGESNRVRKVNVSTGIVATVAGNGTSGYSGDGGPATSAELNILQGVAVDAAGNIYISEYGNNRIRKVTVSTGIITTVAGNGTAGYSGDGGAATSAELNSPEGVAVDTAGNVYIADYSNNRIRKVTVSTGIITTVAGNGTGGYSGDGGQATLAKVTPMGVAVDGAGNIYIADAGNERIRKVTVSTGIITTVAGNGTAGYFGDGGLATGAELNAPYVVAVDAAGNIFIGDVSNERIRKVTASTGIITTVAGNGVGGYSGDGGAATSAELYLPYGVAVDTAANIYIADVGNARVRVVGSASATVTLSSSLNPSTYGNTVTFTATVVSGGSGTITFKDGSTTLGTATLSGGIAGYSTSALAVGTHSITAVYSGGGTSAALVQTVGSASAVTLGSSLNPSTYGTSVTFTATVTPSGALGTVTFLDGSTTLGAATVSGGTASYSTSALVAGTHSITAVYSGNPSYTGSTSSALNQTVNTASTSVGLVSSLNPAIYGNTVTFTATVTPSTATGTITFLDGAATLATVTVNSGKAIYSTGALTAGAHSITAVYSGDAEYAGSTSSVLTETVSVGTILPGPGVINTIAGNGTGGYAGDGGAATLAEVSGPVGVATDGASNVYIVGGNLIREVNVSSGIITTVVGNGTQGYSGDGGPATSAELNGPQRVAVDAAGNIYIADLGNNRIRKVTGSTGIITTVAGNGTAGCSGNGGQATSASLDGPSDVAVDTAGNIYIADTYCSQIRKVTAATGIITTVAGSQHPGYSGDGGQATSAELYLPRGVELDAAGNIYIADHDNNRIRKVTLSTGIITTVAGNGTAGYSGDGGLATSAELNLPSSVAVDTAGNIYVADSNNWRIRKITVSTGIIATVAGNGVQGYSGDGGPATSAELSSPWGVSVDAAANFYIADYSIARVRGVGTTSATVTVASSLNPSTYGNTVLFTATVWSGGSGTVTFKDGATTLGTTPLTGGTASYGTSALAVGVHSITAVYSGGGTSPALIQTVGNASALTLASSLNPSTYGATVAFTATVTPSGAAGTVTFLDGTTTLGAATVSGGTATYSTGVLTAGTHSITAVYSGNPSYTGSTSSVLTQTVNTASSNVVLVSSLNPAIYGNTVTFTATVTPSTATGTIKFLDGASTLATLTLNSGAVASSTSGLAVGTHSITAVYSGDSNDFGSTSSVLTETVSASTILPGAGIINTIAGNGASGYSGDGGAATLAALNPGGVGVDTAGNVYIADAGNHRIRKVTVSTGIITTVAGNGSTSYSGDGGQATSAGLNSSYPWGVSIDGAGNIYIADYLTNRIRKVTLSTGIITTVAGNGTAGYSGDGGQATSARLATPYVAAVDAAGNIYIADYNNNRIRKVTASTGIISTVAGNGTAGYTGDGGLATSAELNRPPGVAVDPLGNIYIVDSGNRIRKVTVSTGIITTVAGTGTAGYSGDGGLATSAELNIPQSVAADSAGNVYIADYGNNRIRKVTASTGIISTMAGNGNGGYFGDGGPATLATLSAVGLATDAAANIYIADNNNRRVRVIGTTKTAMTIASSWNPSAYGSAVTFTATVTPSIATGTVTFKDGTGTLGTVTVSSGIATYSTSALALGSHSITAVYSGDAIYTGSVSSVLTQKVETASAVTVASSLNPSTYGSTVTFTATVTPSSATGTVTFKDGTTTLGTATLSGGTATYSTSALSPGIHSITAVYNGNLTYAGATSSVLVQTVINPTILYISPPAATIGGQVTIEGQYFGSSNGTVKFSNVAATSISSWTAGSITTTVPAGATTGNVVVTTATGLVSNSFPFTVATVPSITNLSITSGAPGQSVTITGTNFGPTQGTSAVLFNGTPASPTSWNSNGMSIVVPVPANAGTGPVVVVVNGLQSNGITFTVTSAPIIQNISPPSGTDATSVTINGSLFGASQAAVSGTVTFNGQTAAPSSWTASKIVVPAPTGVTTGNVVVTANGIPSNGVQFVAAPVITGLTPSSGGIGTAVTIAGRNFGTSGTVTFKGQTATPQSWNPSSIVVPVPNTTTGNVVVTVGGAASNGVPFTVTSAPGITSISPKYGNVGTVATITGSGFGSPQGANSTVSFNGIVVTPQSWTANQIVAQVPQGGVGGQVVVNVNGANSNGIPFLLPPQAPQITGFSMTPGPPPYTLNQGPPYMGFVINGTNLGDPIASTVAVGGVPVVILSGNSTALTVQVPVGAPPGPMDVVVTVLGLPPSNAVPINVIQTFGCAQ